MSDRKEIQSLHAAISRRDWHAVEAAANTLRDQEARPTPDPCDGLVTVAYEDYDDYRDPNHKLVYELRGGQRNGDKDLVYRQNAEAVIAAKDARIEELESDLKTYQDNTSDEVNEKVDLEFKVADLLEENKRLRGVLWKASPV